MMFPFQQYLAKVTVLFLCLWAWMWAQFGPLISCRCSISVARWCVFNMFFMAVAVLGWSCIQDTPSFPSVPHQTTPQTLVTPGNPSSPQVQTLKVWKWLNICLETEGVPLMVASEWFPRSAEGTALRVRVPAVGYLFVEQISYGHKTNAAFPGYIPPKLETWRC